MQKLSKIYIELVTDLQATSIPFDVYTKPLDDSEVNVRTQILHKGTLVYVPEDEFNKHKLVATLELPLDADGKIYPILNEDNETLSNNDEGDFTLKEIKVNPVMDDSDLFVGLTVKSAVDGYTKVMKIIDLNTLFLDLVLCEFTDDAGNLVKELFPVVNLVVV